MDRMLKLILLPVNLALYVPTRIVNAIEVYAASAHQNAVEAIEEFERNGY